MVRDAPLPEVDDGQGPAPQVWGDEIVRVSVRRGVEWAQLQTRRQLEDNGDPVMVLERVEEAGRRAVLAALADSCRALGVRVTTTDVVDPAAVALVDAVLPAGVPRVGPTARPVPSRT